MATTTTIDKLRAKAAVLDAQAAALRLAATFLDEEFRQGKRGAVDKTLKGAVALRQAQKNGHNPGPSWTAPEARTPWTKPERRPHRRGTGSWKATVARRTKKREQIVALVKAYGKPMPIAALTAAARKAGVGSLTGISGSVRAGYLKQTGQRGKTVYSIPKSADRAASSTDTRSM